MFYYLICTVCRHCSEPQRGTPPGPYTTRVCGVCLQERRCEVRRLTEEADGALVEVAP